MATPQIAQGQMIATKCADLPLTRQQTGAECDWSGGASRVERSNDRKSCSVSAGKKAAYPAGATPYQPPHGRAKGCAVIQGLTVRGSERLGSKAKGVRSSREGAEAEGAIMESGRSLLDSNVRHGARRMLQAALESAVDAFLEEHAALVDESGRRCVVRHGYLPSREIPTESA